jgi:catechol 2,3-dioxygenase-like lactoylglutathione lyase family enzyme
MREGYSMDDVDDWLDDAAGELRRLRSATAARQAAKPAEQVRPEQTFEQPYPQPFEQPRPAPAYEPPRVEPSYEHAGMPSTAFASTMAQPAPVAPAPPPPPTAYARLEPEPVYHQPIRPSLEPDPRPVAQVPTPTTGLNHLEVWVRDLDVAIRSFGWLFERLGWTLFQVWDQGRSWQAPREGPYVVMERSPDLAWQPYDRKAPGLNHLALAVPERWMVDRIVSEAPTYGWRLMFADRHPHAGGAQHYAAYLENEEGFEVEVVAP